MCHCSKEMESMKHQIFELTKTVSYNVIAFFGVRILDIKETLSELVLLGTFIYTVMKISKMFVEWLNHKKKNKTKGN